MLPYLTVKETIARGLMGAQRYTRPTQVSSTRWTWDIAGRCEKPVKVNLFSRNQKGRIFDYNPGESDIPLEVDMDTVCRKCRWCLRQRSRLWETRAYNEYLISSRVWLGTLTFNQEARTKNLQLAHQLARKAGFDLDGASDNLRSKYRHKANTAELARFLKRVRKNADTRYRYLLCSEDHEDGTPHYHVLIFESFAFSQISKRVLDGAWRLGYSQFRLCDADAARYVTKYLSKDARSRVRASSRLGSGPRSKHNERSECAPPTPGGATEEGTQGSPVVISPKV